MSDILITYYTSHGFALRFLFRKLSHFYDHIYNLIDKIPYAKENSAAFVAKPITPLRVYGRNKSIVFINVLTPIQYVYAVYLWHKLLISYWFSWGCDESTRYFPLLIKALKIVIYEHYRADPLLAVTRKVIIKYIRKITDFTFALCQWICLWHRKKCHQLIFLGVQGLGLVYQHIAGEFSMVYSILHEIQSAKGTVPLVILFITFDNFIIGVNWQREEVFLCRLHPVKDVLSWNW